MGPLILCVGAWRPWHWAGWRWLTLTGSAGQFSGAGALPGLHPPSSMSRTLSQEGSPSATDTPGSRAPVLGFSGQGVSTPVPVPGLVGPHRPWGPCSSTEASRRPLLLSQCLQSSGPTGHAFLWVHVVGGGGTRDLEIPVPGDREASHPSLWPRPEAPTPAPAPDWGSYGLLGSCSDAGTAPQTWWSRLLLPLLPSLSAFFPLRSRAVPFPE